MFAAAKSLQSCLTLCDPIDGSPPGSAAPGILQARTLEWVAISFSSAWKWKVKVRSFSRVRLLANPLDCSLPGSSIYGIFQARVLEWGTIAFSTISPTHCFFPMFHILLFLSWLSICSFLNLNVPTSWLCPGKKCSGKNELVILFDEFL